MNLWRQQLAAILRLELKKSFLSRRAIWIYLLAFGPVLICAGHSIRVSVDDPGCTIAHDTMIFAGLFLFFYLRLAIYFGALGIFSNLFRRELLEKTLHFYFLAPVRREIVVAGKFIAGVIASVVLFTTSAALGYLLIAAHFGQAWQDYLIHGPGLGHLGWYMLTAALGCVGYGAVFLAAGMIFRNPMIPAATVMVWEGINNFLPSALQKVSVIFYLKGLCPVEVPLRGLPALFALAADPVPAWAAIPGVLAVSALILAFAAFKARSMEVHYTE